MEDFESWALARGGALARTAYLLAGDVQLAEDLVQDTLARVADRWRTVRRQGSPAAYARTVMHHLAIDRWRRRRARPPEVLTDRHPELGDVGPDVERRLVLREALARLTAKQRAVKQRAVKQRAVRQRAVLSLRFYEDLTEVQTAAVLGCSVSTVKSQTRAASSGSVC